MGKLAIGADAVSSPELSLEGGPADTGLQVVEGILSI